MLGKNLCSLEETLSLLEELNKINLSKIRGSQNSSILNENYCKPMMVLFLFSNDMIYFYWLFHGLSVNNRTTWRF